MSKFTKQVTKEYQFDGDTVTVTMRRLKRKDAIKLAPFLGDADEDGNISMTTEKSFEFVDKAGDILSKYVVSISGLTDASGNVIPKEEVLDQEEGESYFMGLLSDMMNDLMNISFLSGEEVKKSNDSPEDTSTGLVEEEETHS